MVVSFFEDAPFFSRQSKAVSGSFDQVFLSCLVVIDVQGNKTSEKGKTPEKMKNLLRCVLRKLKKGVRSLFSLGMPLAEILDSETLMRTN